MMNQYEKEEDALYQDYENGLLTSAELQKELRLLRREYREAAEDCARTAYEEALQNW